MRTRLGDADPKNKVFHAHEIRKICLKKQKKLQKPGEGEKPYTKITKQVAWKRTGICAYVTGNAGPLALNIEKTLAQQKSEGVLQLLFKMDLGVLDSCEGGRQTSG